MKRRQKSSHEALENAAASVQEDLRTTNAAVEALAQKAATALSTTADKIEVTVE